MSSSLFRVSVRDTGVLAGLSNAPKRIGFTIQNGLNDTAKDVQEAEVVAGENDFTIRKPFFRRQLAIIKPFASYAAGRLRVTISVGQRDRLLLERFETGGLRGPFKTGAHMVAVPKPGSAARPSFRASVPAQLEVKALRLRATRRRGRPRKGATVKKLQFKGEQRTFTLKSARQPLGGIFQRIGPGSAGIRILYPFVRPQQLGRRLHFRDTARRVAAVRFPINLRRRIRETLAFNLRRTS